MPVWTPQPVRRSTVRSWTPAAVYKPFARNVLLYDGPSQLTGAPILVIATAHNGNRKIGAMVQLWILPAISPIEAVRTGGDDAVCGDCKLRGDRGAGRSCYVEYWRSVENIHQCRDRARRMAPEAFAATWPGLQLRVGAYGDPVAVPLHVWTGLLSTAAGWTAYTHQWRRAEAQVHRAYAMASVDSVAEQIEATALGWRTFRVRSSDDADPLIVGEVTCPASDEGGHRTTCDRCSLCRGLARPAKSIAIVVHGSRARWFPVALHRSQAAAVRS